MRVKMLTRVEIGYEVHEKAGIKSLESMREKNPQSFKHWSPRETDRGAVLSIHVVQRLLPGDVYVLPTDEAEKLIALGYATRG